MDRGRKAKYKTEYDQIAKKLTVLGMTQKEIADFLGITEKTLYNWKKKNRSFKEAIERNRFKADIKVMQSLYKRANGFTYKEVTKKLVTLTEHDEEGQEIEVQKFIKTKEVKKTVPPDVSAIMIWLRNRMGQMWKDKPKDEGMSITDLLQNMQTVADLINSPVPNRTLAEVEGEEDE